MLRMHHAKVGSGLGNVALRGACTNATGEIAGLTHQRGGQSDRF